MQITYRNFCLLHNHLLSILTTNNHENQYLPEKALQYVGMIVESQKNADEVEDYFDYFCENQGNKILKLILQVDHLLTVKCLSLLFINLRKQIWISYLLCQPFINEAIQPIEVQTHEEWAEYFISFLKSLSIRINGDQLSLFFNKKCCKFPLVYEALKYYNHQDCMVRTNVMNIILGIMKIKDQRLSHYFSSFPFTSYILTYCCEIKDRIQKFNVHLLQTSYKIGTSSSPRALKNTHKAMIKMYSIDLSDYICFLDDIMSYGSDDLAFFIRNALLSYIVLPYLKHIHSESPKILVKSSIYLLFNLFKLINDTKFKQTLCLLILGKRIPRIYLEKLERIEDVLYTPKVYTTEFNVNTYYWNKFNYQIQEQCLKVFKDIEHFEVDHDSEKENPKHKYEFEQELGKISEFLSFDILSYGKNKNKNHIPLSCLPEMLNLCERSEWTNEEQEIQFEINPVRDELRKIWYQVSNDEEQDDLLTCISTLIIYIIRCDSLENSHLKFCGFLLPRFDTVNYLDQYNINSLMKLKETILKTLSSNINKKLTETTPILRLSSLRNLLFLVDEGLYKRLSEEEERIYHNFYTHSIEQVKNLINVKNIKEIVENFEFDYGKWWKQCFIPDGNISHSIFGFRIQFGKDSPNDDIQSQFICHLSNSKEHVQYAIRYFVITQAYYFKYVSQHCLEDDEERKSLEPYTEKFSKIYQQKYCKVEEMWKIGKSYQIQYRHMVECFGVDDKNKVRNKKNLKKLIIVQDNYNIVVVEPSSQENTAKILVNNPWKYVTAQINREQGSKLIIKFSHCIGGNTRIQLYFPDEVRCAGTLEWMNKLKYERYQSEQAFILGYLKDCLSYQ